MTNTGSSTHAIFCLYSRDSKTIELLSRLSIGVFYAASNCSKAVKVLEKIREKYDAALFFEQVNLSQDIADIQYMRKKYPGLYMILVIDSLSKEEASEYLKAGINNTIKYETSQEALKDLSTFLKRRKDQKIKHFSLKHKILMLSDCLYGNELLIYSFREWRYYAFLLS